MRDMNNCYKSELKYTDEDVDRILKRKFAEWEKKQKKRWNHRSIFLGLCPSLLIMR